MLEIEYKGANSVIVSSKDTTLWVDPRSNVDSFKTPKGAVIYLATESRFLPPQTAEGLQLEGPGEYEAGPFSMQGIAAQRHIDSKDQGKQATIYRIDTGEFRIALLGNVDATLSEEQLEMLGVVDVLILPVGGGGYTLDATSAATIVRQIEPKAVIPVHYSGPGVSYEVPQDAVDTFIHELGVSAEVAPKLKFKAATALPPSLTVYQLGG